MNTTCVRVCLEMFDFYYERISEYEYSLICSVTFSRTYLKCQVNSCSNLSDKCFNTNMFIVCFFFVFFVFSSSEYDYKIVWIVGVASFSLSSCNIMSVCLLLSACVVVLQKLKVFFVMVFVFSPQQIIYKNK